MHSATDPDAKNLRANTSPDQDPPQHIQSYIDDDVQGNEDQKPQMPIIHPEELVGKVLSVTQEDGQTTRLKIIEAINDHHDASSGYKPTVKFKCSVNNDAYEEILSYNQILDYLEKDDDDIMWKFKDIIGHQGPLQPNHKDYKGSTYNLTILWENGETSI